MVMFAFALDTRRRARSGSRPGLIWLATLFSLLILVQRSFAVETADGALDALRVAGVDPAGIFLGKAMALAVQLLVLEVLLMLLAVVLYDARGRRGEAHGVAVRVARRHDRAALPAGWPSSVRSTAASLPGRGTGDAAPAPAALRWWRPC